MRTIYDHHDSHRLVRFLIESNPHHVSFWRIAAKAAFGPLGTYAVAELGRETLSFATEFCDRNSLFDFSCGKSVVKVRISATGFAVTELDANRGG